MIPSKTAVYVYRNHVDWNDKSSVNRLNQWRAQVFRRCLGPMRDGRPRWTRAEQKALTDILQTELTSSKTHGRWSKLDWDRIADKLNKRFANVLFPKGERLADTKQQLTNDKWGNDCTAYKQPTVFLERSATAIHLYVKKFADPQIMRLMGDAQNLDEEHRLGGFDEVSHAEVEEVQQGKKKRKAVSTLDSGNAKKKSRVASVEKRPIKSMRDSLKIAKKARATKPTMTAPNESTPHGTTGADSIAHDLTQDNTQPTKPQPRLFKFITKANSTSSTPPPMTEDNKRKIVSHKQSSPLSNHFQRHQSKLKERSSSVDNFS